MLYTGLDQISIVVTYPLEDLTLDSWDHVAKALITTIEDTLKLTDIYGDRHRIDGVAHYSKAYGYGLASYVFYIAYNPGSPSTGILIYFSANALNEYRLRFQKKYQININANDILRMLQTAGLFCHASRLDLYADYIDEDQPIDLTALYNALVSGSVKIVDHNGRRNASKLSSMSANDKVETIYIGTRSKNTRALARIYDKKTEQLNNPYGFRKETARTCNSWTRIEVELHSFYAKKLTSDLASCSSEDLQAFIAATILSKYTLVYTENKSPLPFTKSLEECRHSKDIILAYPSEGDRDLRRKYDYLINDSGLFSLIDMVSAVWGEMGVRILMERLNADYESHIMKRKTRDWIRKNRDDLAPYTPPFGEHGNE